VIVSSNHPPAFVPMQGSAYRTDTGEVFVYEGTKWCPAKVVYTVFGVAPDSVDFDLAPNPSPGRNPQPALHWKETAVTEDEAWPPGEVTHGIGIMTLRMSTHGDDPTSYMLEVAGWDLKKVEQRWRHVAQTLVPAELWRELEPVS
jgi:hypothetical protein